VAEGFVAAVAAAVEGGAGSSETDGPIVIAPDLSPTGIAEVALTTGASSGSLSFEDVAGGVAVAAAAAAAAAAVGVVTTGGELDTAGILATKGAIACFAAITGAGTARGTVTGCSPIVITDDFGRTD